MKVGIYKNIEGGVSIVIPSPRMTAPVEETIALAVPTGTPFALVDQDTIPTDRTFRDAWEVDALALLDGVGVDEIESPAPVVEEDVDVPEMVEKTEHVQVDLGGL